MFEEMVLYHNILVQILIVVLLVGISIPFWSSDLAKIVRRMRIYMFWSHGTITTVAFSGLIAFIFGKISLDMGIIAMIVVYILLILFESIKYIKILNLSKTKENPIREIKVINIGYTLINVLLILLIIIWQIEEKANAVSLS
jgi:hypothetical protein